MGDTHWVNLPQTWTVAEHSEGKGGRRTRNSWQGGFPKKLGRHLALEFWQEMRVSWTTTDGGCCAICRVREG